VWLPDRRLHGPQPEVGIWKKLERLVDVAKSIYERNEIISKGK